MANISSYNNDRVVTGEVEYPVNDPASGAFFQPEYKKNEDLKLMLDGSKDSLKLEAMKRIIGMIAKGRDASDLFPAVVKNVVSKNIEVKKLVYVYLVRYAEEQQDLALLSISTFQRALKDPNQLIRASALRVLSSIRVGMIVPIVMLAIRDSSCDMSPYVRKTAAHAIPKLYSIDPEQKEELVQVIEKLLGDKAPLVVGSAAMAFSEVCPEKMPLLHKSYRKLCALLADVDEWGQLALLNVLTVYCKTFFADPAEESYSTDSEKQFYESDSDVSDLPRIRKSMRSPVLEQDHKLVLRATKPLLQSRNSGVVLAVAQLFYHCAPLQELPPVAKAMVRLLRAPVEVQSVVLTTIASLTVEKKGIFEPFLKSFFVRNSDPTHIKLIKLEILTNLCTETNASLVLKELNTYLSSNDPKAQGATIQAIGRLAVTIPSQTDTCLNGLLQLLSSKDEAVVCEAVVVVKRVVRGAGARPAVSRAAALLRNDRLAAPARSAAVWLVAEHGASHPRAAAVLAHLAQNFALQDELVKLQVLSLAVKLSITQPDTIPICNYVLTLAKYDQHYDVRDRARMLRACVDGQNSKLHQHLKKIFLPAKPSPLIESSFKDRGKYIVGSLSQYVGFATSGYRPLPTDINYTDSSHLREPDAAQTYIPEANQPTKSLYSEPESSSSESSSSSSGEEESSDEVESANEENLDKKTKPANNSESSSSSGTSDSESSSQNSESESESNESSSDNEETIQKDKKKEPSLKNNSNSDDHKTLKSNMELLLELDEASSNLPTMTPTCGGFLSPPTETDLATDDSITPVGPSISPSSPTELVSRTIWAGVGVNQLFTRSPHLYSNTMCTLQLTFSNHSQVDVTDIKLQVKSLSPLRKVHEFPSIPLLSAGASITTTIGIDFADTIQPVHGCLIGSNGEVNITITPSVGELMRSVIMSEKKWDTEQKRLRGMTECVKKAKKFSDNKGICQRVFEIANVSAITTSGNMLRFAGKMLASQDLVLLSVLLEDDGCKVTANCSNMAVASLLANNIANSFDKA